MRRAKLTRNELPTEPRNPLPFSAHDEVTVVDGIHRVTMPDGRVKPRIHYCDGRGFSTEILDKPFATPCWCPAGQRMVCAIPPEEWPLRVGDAVKLAKRIGLRKVAA